jgi:hypothetical protein
MAAEWRQASLSSIGCLRSHMTPNRVATSFFTAIRIRVKPFFTFFFTEVRGRAIYFFNKQ